MTVRRSSARLAAAISAVLAAPATLTGVGIVAGMALTPVAFAQETTAQLGGQVNSSDGSPVAGAKVVILHVPTGTPTTLTTNANGRFTAAGLRVGGPYKVSAEAEGMQPDAVENIYARLGQPVSVPLTLQATAVLAEIEVTGSAEREVAVGSSRSYSAADVSALASVSRDIKDVVRVDPKAFIDPTNQDALEIAGTNNRYNSLSVDGVRQGDDFGLNNNGYPSTRSPVSLDAVEAVSVKTSPFDVKLSGFQGGAINIVTKSGTNEFHGSAFYYKYDDSMAGDQSGDRTFVFDFEEKTYGGTFGGPILKDKLFFFLSYEKLERLAPQSFGPTGSAAPVPIPGVTQAEYDQIRSIAQSVYGYDPGVFASSLPEDDEKILAKIDWQISDNHRATFAYQSSEGSAIVDPNSSSSGRRLSAPANNYNRFIDLKQYSLQLNSNWNEWLSTEFLLGRKETDTFQDPLGGTEFAEMQITTPSGGTVYLGPDEFRHANFLTNNLDQAKLRANMAFGDHTITLGAELEQLDVFNLFVPRSKGQYTFTGASGITNFQNRAATGLRYNNAYTNNADDGAGAFAVDQWAFYVQDAWQLTDTFLLQGGIRYDMWNSSDKPAYNQNFFNRYGFANTETLDGQSLFSPRLGFNWQVNERTNVYGGIGLFGGGTPNVWFSNSFANDGVTVVEQQYTRPSGALSALQDAA
ncbi:MAG: TonB-dependent receptor, partial [Gammaproteobacteria bacterium]|nr:TonB-dependent receptor [Gammaproteobacteria bacterium]